MEPTSFLAGYGRNSRHGDKLHLIHQSNHQLVPLLTLLLNRHLDLLGLWATPSKHSTHALQLPAHQLLQQQVHQR
jgi:hypothetical protein